MVTCTWVVGFTYYFLKRETYMLNRLVDDATARNLSTNFIPPSALLLATPLQVNDATLKAAMRRATVSLKFVPVFMGSAYKNKVGYVDSDSYLSVNERFSA